MQSSVHTASMFSLNQHCSSEGINSEKEGGSQKNIVLLLSPNIKYSHLLLKTCTLHIPVLSFTSF